ncbi:unnamed protein product [Clonostachys chloroleuca]|uniref:SANT domain-containing protein n=1 Tax=Clonostachys chloroleuca TaxID=1926264 RepID=A0AA35Q262_9HYPO|nr:unnamed protein product [Clonostachys chloroleuca]
MSSMFKKRGGLAFKPKLPVARPRPTAPTSQPPKPAAAEAQITPPPSDVSSLTEIAQPETSVPETSSTGTPETSLEPVQGPAANHPAIATQPNPSPDLPPASESDDHPLAAEHTAPPPHALPRQDTSETLPASTNQADDQRPQPAAEYATPSSTLQELVEVPPAEAAITPGASEACETLQPTPPSSITRRKRTTAAATAEASDSTAVTAPRKRQRKTTQNEDDGATEAPARKPRRPRATTGEEGTRTPRRARSLTPEDAENQVVDLQKLKMSDLTRDLHIGKKFSRHDELRERERQARIKGKSRTESEGPEAEGEKVEANGSTSNSAGATPSNPALSAAPSQATAGPQFRIVDGQIVLDQSSLVMDRHARAVATQGEMEMVEENDFTRLITSSSFMNTSKLKGPNIWTAEETKLFYRGLAMFGTDFEMISKMFPGKQRRHVKLKYNREERHAPQLIHAATYGEKTTKMDLNEYKSLTGTVFESVESIEAGQRKMQEDFEAEQKRIADEQAEVMRKKREELFADDDKAEDGYAKKKKKRKTKQQHEDEGRYGEVVIEEDL